MTSSTKNIRTKDEALNAVNILNSKKEDITSITNGVKTTYSGRYFLIGIKTIYLLLKSTVSVSGVDTLKYVTVQKVTNNPWKSLGKDFKSFDEAVSSYKNADIKTALLKFELGLA